MGLNRALHIRMGEDDIGFVSSSSSSTSVLLSDTGSSHLKLRHVTIDDVRYFNAIPVERLTSICIRFATELESLSEVGELFKRCSSLRKLMIWFCFKLRTLSGGLEYLTSLESLSINATPIEKDDDGLPWRSLARNLHSLELNQIMCWEFLPQGLHYLTSLQHLKIISCVSLKTIPEWIGCLSSLQSLILNGCILVNSLPNAIRILNSLQRLEIKRCSKLLLKRCQNPKGEDWPKIQHIPSISISE